MNVLGFLKLLGLSFDDESIQKLSTDDMDKIIKLYSEYRQKEDDIQKVLEE